MTIQEHLRSNLSTKLIPLIKKNKCEICSNDENLEVHHLTFFKDILDETLLELKLEYKDTKDYSSNELSLITNVVLGKHLNIEYLTLCEECHTKIHSKNWGDICNNENYQQYYTKQSLIKDMKREKYNYEILVPYLDNMLNKRLLKTDQKELAEKVDIRRNGKLMKSYASLNEYFSENNIHFIIKSDTDHTRKLKNGSQNSQYSKVYWTVHETNTNLFASA